VDTLIVFAILVVLVGSGVITTATILATTRLGGGPKSKRAIIAQYSPPPAISVLVGALVIGERKRSMAAQFVDLAVRGAIRILTRLTPGGPFRIELVDKAVATGSVESQVIRAVFGDRAAAHQIVRVTSANAPLSRRLQTAQTRAATFARDGGYITTRSVDRRVVLLAAHVVVVVVAALLDGGVTVAIGAMAVATAIACFWPRRTLTAAGVELRDHLLGLREYISLAEADRMRVLQAPGTALTKGEIYLLTEKLLGWAVLFGFGKEWARVLEIQARELGDDRPGGSGDVYIYSDFSGSFDGFATGESGAPLTDSFAPGDFGDSSSSSGGFDFGDASSSGGWGSDGGGDGGGGDGGGGGGD
jgi:hypothetical protein